MARRDTVNPIIISFPWGRKDGMAHEEDDPVAFHL
jgi:hypothetical protein